MDSDESGAWQHGEDSSWSLWSEMLRGQAGEVVSSGAVEFRGGAWVYHQIKRFFGICWRSCPSSSKAKGFLFVRALLVFSPVQRVIRIRGQLDRP